MTVYIYVPLTQVFVIITGEFKTRDPITAGSVWGEDCPDVTYHLHDASAPMSTANNASATHFLVSQVVKHIYLPL